MINLTGKLMGAWKHSEHGFLPKDGYFSGVQQQGDMINVEIQKARIGSKKYGPTLINSIMFTLLFFFGFMFSALKYISNKGNFFKRRKKVNSFTWNMFLYLPPKIFPSFHWQTFTLSWAVFTLSILLISIS